MLLLLFFVDAAADPDFVVVAVVVVLVVTIAVDVAFSAVIIFHFAFVGYPVCIDYTGRMSVYYYPFSKTGSEKYVGTG